VLSILNSICAGIFLMLMALVIFALGLICFTAIPYTIIHRLRLGFKFLLRGRWTLWYVRRAVDAAIIGFICLLGAWLACLPTAVSLAGDIGRALYLSSAKVQELFYYHDGAPGKLADSLIQLQSLQFFLDHFIQYVILPAFVVGFAGYSFERHNQQKKKNQVT
jgi:hypothetical protein